MTMACSMSPLASVRACLQSIMGAPVFSRSSFTCPAEIFTVVVPIIIRFFPELRVSGFERTDNGATNHLETANLELVLQNSTRAGQPARVTLPFGLSPDFNLSLHSPAVHTRSFPRPRYLGISLGFHLWNVFALFG